MREATRAGPYLVLGAAASALVGWLGFAFVRSIAVTSGLTRVLVVLLTILAIAIAGAILLSPFVRDAAVALARPLLGLRLPPVRDRDSWDSRWHGAVWALWVMLVGGAAALVLLTLVPIGVLLGVGAGGWQLLWRVPLGVVIAVAGFVAQFFFCLLLVRTAPRLLGPTAGDRLAQARERELRLAQHNALARELHDGIGHALTAIDVQAQAGLAVDSPEASRRALAQIRTATHRALDDLDGLLGILREEATPTGGPVGPTDLAALVAEAPTEPPSELHLDGPWSRLPAEHTRVVFRVVQEGVTNAVRHGVGPASVRVQVDTDHVLVQIDNEVGAATAGDRPGRGLLGLAERLRLHGGTVRTERIDGELDGEPEREVPRAMATDRDPAEVSIRVLVVDDDAMVRDGFAAILASAADIEVVGTAADGVEALDLLGRLAPDVPDVVVMDVRMPRLDGIETTRRLLARHDARVLVVTTFSHDAYVYDALQVGAAGFLLKRAGADQLLLAVRTLSRTDAVLFPTAIRDLVAERVPRRTLPPLSEREAEVLRLLAQGMTNAEIAAALFLGTETVKTHIGALLAKLDVRDRTQAVIAAFESGFVR